MIFYSYLCSMDILDTFFNLNDSVYYDPITRSVSIKRADDKVNHIATIKSKGWTGDVWGELIAKSLYEHMLRRSVEQEFEAEYAPHLITEVVGRESKGGQVVSVPNNEIQVKCHELGVVTRCKTTRSQLKNFEHIKAMFIELMVRMKNGIR